MPIEIDTSDFEAFVSSLSAREAKYMRNVEKVASEVVKEESALVIPKIEGLEDLAVQQWYAAYSPKKYVRRWTLENIFSAYDASSSFNLTIIGQYDESASLNRTGESLYGYSYVGGSHGGVTVSTPPDMLLEEQLDMLSASISEELQQKISSRMSAIDF